jgi:hypothetical protein
MLGEPAIKEHGDEEVPKGWQENLEKVYVLFNSD